MNGLMMFQPLLISSLIEHANRYHSDGEIVSVETNGSIVRTNYAEVRTRALKLASALNQTLGEGDHVCGTIAWNNRRHLETYFATSGSGKICHTINPRLSPEQMVYVINQAEDKVLFVDRTFLPIIAALQDKLPTLEHIIVMDDQDDNAETGVNNILSYESFLAKGSDDYLWPALDETQASSLCYTSGTTNMPKGVLYSHRSTVLHTFAATQADGMAISASDIVLPVVPMFHVNAWGIPYAAAMTGCKLVLPGPGLDGESLMNLINGEQVTLAAGVPTLWTGLLGALKAADAQVPSLERTVVGGSACPPSMIEQFRDEYDVKFVHAWGMTETSPLGTLNTVKAKHKDLSSDELTALSCMQGRPPFGVELEIWGENGEVLPNDGKTQGDLMIKGHWIVESYFKNPDSPLQNGWFPTGDVSTINEDGYMHIRDRSKDIIKSGGEWISSVDLENIAVAHPAIAEAGVIAAEHEKWAERPLLVAVKMPDTDISEADLIAYYDGKVPNWWKPDAVVFTDVLPRNATGKVLKNVLRDKFGKTLLGA